MTYFNRSGEAFVPPGYPGIDWETAQDPEISTAQEHGLYYRSRVFPELAAEVEEAMKGVRALGTVSIDAVQAWTEQGWKKPHASAEAAERLISKLLEEIREASDALEEYWDSRDRAHFIEEIGDVHWVMTALASNGRAVVNDSMKQRLYDYAAGTKVYRWGQGFGYPDWYDAAAQLSIRRGSLTIGEIDGLIEAGFVPRVSARMNLYEEEEISPTSYLTWDFMMYAAALRRLSEQLYGTDEVRPALDGTDISRQIGEMVADSWLKVAAMAHYAGGTLEEVMRTNITKVSGRVLQNLVDRTDGERRPKD